MVLVFEVVSLLLAVIGAITSLWFIVEKMGLWQRLSWRCAERSAEKVARQLVADAYTPSLIVGIGRGGAIFGAMISGCLGHRPLLVIDRKYTWKGGRRIDDMILRMNLPDEMLSSLLLVAGEAHTGNTMKLYFDYFRQLGASDVRRAALFLQDGCTEKVEYWGVKGGTDRRMPWMFSQSYRRDSRGLEEALNLVGPDAISEARQVRPKRKRAQGKGGVVSGGAEE
jgi:hypoxanthine phosphoribosyltransferase